MNRQQLENKIRAGIPISAHMDFRVLELSENGITVKGGGDENVNVHGTAFAGSQYAVATLAVWGLVNSRLPDNASLVMAEGNIRYVKPVVGDIVARCEVDADEMQAFLASVNGKGKGRLVAVARVAGDDAPAAEFTGHVYARLHP
jgi:thioesterase domain-containing protein